MKVRFFNVKKSWRKLICCRSSVGNYGLLFRSKKEKVVFKFRDFDDDRIKERAQQIARFFTGVTSVDIEGKWNLKVIGSFDKFKLMKRLKKIDQHVDIIEVIQIQEAEKQVNKPSVAKTQALRPQKAPIDSKKVINKPSDAAGSSGLYGGLKYYGGRVVEQINRENTNKLIAYGRGVVGYFSKEDPNKGKKGTATAFRELNIDNPSINYARDYGPNRIDGKNNNAGRPQP